MAGVTAALLWALFGFVLGALPFSPWIGRLALNKDIRAYGDRNPGATNVLRAGGPGWFFAALLLDISKGALPVGIAAYIFNWQGVGLLLIALAPPLGHAFSPLLQFKGGKAVAASFGVWIGLGLWQLALPPLLLLVIWSLLLRPSGWALLAAMLSLGIYLMIVRPESLLLAVWLAQTLLFVVRYGDDLRQRPSLFLSRNRTAGSA